MRCVIQGGEANERVREWERKRERARSPPDEEHCAAVSSVVHLMRLQRCTGKPVAPTPTDGCVSAYQCPGSGSKSGWMEASACTAAHYQSGELSSSCTWSRWFTLRPELTGGTHFPCGSVNINLNLIFFLNLCSHWALTCQRTCSTCYVRVTWMQP